MDRRKFLKNIWKIAIAIGILSKTNSIDKNPTVKASTRIVPIITGYNPDTKIATFDWSKEPGSDDTFAPV